MCNPKSGTGALVSAAQAELEVPRARRVARRRAKETIVTKPAVPLFFFSHFFPSFSSSSSARFPSTFVPSCATVAFDPVARRPCDVLCRLRVACGRTRSKPHNVILPSFLRHRYTRALHTAVDKTEPDGPRPPRKIYMYANRTSVYHYARCVLAEIHIGLCNYRMFDGRKDSGNRDSENCRSLAIAAASLGPR